MCVCVSGGADINVHKADTGQTVCIGNKINYCAAAFFVHLCLCLVFGVCLYINKDNLKFQTPTHLLLVG